MKTLFLILSRGGLLRNLSESSVISRLCESGFRVVILTPPSDEQEQFAHLLSGRDVTFEPLSRARPSFIRRVLQELQRAVVYNDTVKSIQSYTIGSKTDPSRVLYLPRLYLFPAIRYIPFMKQFLRWLGSLLDPQKENDNLFTKYHPDVVFSTTPHDESEVAVLKSAVRFGVTSVCMPKSWDNLSKILFPVKTKRILIWGQNMKEEAIALQGYAPEELIITGAAQFDFYAHKEHLWSREEFARRHGLDPRKKIILYGSGGADMCDEARFVDLLEEYMVDRNDVQVLIRSHAGYRDDATRYAKFSDHANVLMDRTISQSFSDRSVWDINPDRLYNLFNSLYHADVCVNVGSTLTIDATICGTPVINLDFDVDKNIDHKRRSVKRLFETRYVKSMLKMNATWLVTSREDLFKALTETLANKKAKLNERQRLIEKFVYANDGKSAERVAEAVASL